MSVCVIVTAYCYGTSMCQFGKRLVNFVFVEKEGVIINCDDYDDGENYTKVCKYADGYEK